MFWWIQQNITECNSLITLNGLYRPNPNTVSIRDLLRDSSKGKPSILSDVWYPFEVIHENTSGKTSGVNCPGVGLQAHAWDQIAIDVLGPLVEPYVEFLPLICKQSNYWVINVLEVVDCLDHELSELTYLPSGGVKKVSHYHFRPNCLDNRVIFRMPEHNHSRVIVSDVFKEIYDSSGLTGLKFKALFE